MIIEDIEELIELCGTKYYKEPCNYCKEDIWYCYSPERCPECGVLLHGSVCLIRHLSEVHGWKFENGKLISKSSAIICTGEEGAVSSGYGVKRLP
jgi:hypothetical protein